MKKKLTGVVLALMLMCASILTGCSLITTNWDQYYNAVVATIEDKDGNFIDDITKRELMTAYSSFGTYYEQYYGQTKKQAVETTLSQLETRKITIAAAEKQFKAENPEDKTEVLTKIEKSYLWKETSDSFFDNFQTYVDQITGEGDEESNSSNEDVVKFEKFKKQATPVAKTNENGITEYIIKPVSQTEELLSEFEKTYDSNSPRDASTKDGRLLIYNSLIEKIQSSYGETSAKAFNLYKQAITRSEENLTFEENTTVDKFLREIERIYQINYENYIVEKWTDQYREKFVTESDVSVERLLDLYVQKVLNSYSKYVLESDDGYEDDVLSDLSQINYFKEGQNDTKFYTVAHILFKFSDEQSEAYQQAKTDLANGKISLDQYNYTMDLLKAQVKPLVRKANSVGEYTESSEKATFEQSVTDLYDYISDQISQIKDPIEKAEKFNEFIYKYNEDPGIMNAEYNYVMGLNKAAALEEGATDVITLQDGRKYVSHSQMVPEFTLAGAELYNDGQGKVGDISPIIMTENGFHILMYTGACQNYFDDIITQYVNSGEAYLSEGAIEMLNSIRLNVMNTKTIFDDLYEELAQDNFSSFQSKQMATLMENAVIKHYENEYKDMF